MPVPPAIRRHRRRNAGTPWRTAGSLDRGASLGLVLRGRRSGTHRRADPAIWSLGRRPGSPSGRRDHRPTRVSASQRSWLFAPAPVRRTGKQPASPGSRRHSSTWWCYRSPPADHRLLGVFLLRARPVLQESKGSLADLGMAVVVQRQLTAAKSGVLFTRTRSDSVEIRWSSKPPMGSVRRSSPAGDARTTTWHDVMAGEERPSRPSGLDDRSHTMRR